MKIDRSESAKRSAATAKERYGTDWHRKNGLKGGNPVLLAQREANQMRAKGGQNNKD